MEQPTDSRFERQLDEFTRRIEALQQQHQQVAYALCVERLARDMGMLADPSRPPTFLHRLGDWLAERHNRVTPVTTRPEVSSRVIVIDAVTGDVTEEQEASDG